MTDYVRQCTQPRNKWETDEVNRLIADFESKATVTDGVVRWNSNDSVPPEDILVLWRYVGKPFDFDRSVAAREVDVDREIAAYRKRMENHVPSAEELFEMRAAFGPGAEVVNVITGQVTKL